MTTIIVALTSDLAIGKDGDLLYHIPADMRRFRQLTTGHTVIMGRKTFESLPSGPLPNRRNIIVSRRNDLEIQGAEVAASLGEAIYLAENDHIYIIGGAQIYEAAINVADRLELTEIIAERPDADTFFPVIDPEQWRTVAVTDPETDPRSGVTYRYHTLERLA